MKGTIVDPTLAQSRDAPHTAPASMQEDAAPPTESMSRLRQMSAQLRARLTHDLGAVPVIVGLIVIWIGFQLVNQNYLSSRNLSNLILQTGVVAILALGVILVLLIGEIDLSLGATAGVTAALLGVTLTEHGWPAWASMALAIAVGAAIGALQGSIVVAMGVPSFVVTLGGGLAWQGVQLGLLGKVGELRISDTTLFKVANAYVPAAWSWILLGLVVVAFAGLSMARRGARRRAGALVSHAAWSAAQIMLVAVCGAVVVGALNAYFGVPVLLVILFGLTVLLTWLMRRTPYGRHLYAIGGNAEAARRAGIPVGWTRISVFTLASALAGVAGIVSVSRQFSVSTGTGGGTLLLEAIAAAVIGGASLFGGRGRPYQALLGALVITSVANGLDLLGEPSSVKNVATGTILVLAVCMDALSRRRTGAAAA
jgi:D-xylose transport system permease protein